MRWPPSIIPITLPARLGGESQVTPGGWVSLFGEHLADSDNSEFYAVFRLDRGHGGAH